MCWRSSVVMMQLSLAFFPRPVWLTWIGCRLQCRTAGLEVTYRLCGHLVAVSPSLDLSMYRIVQEALTNVTKHAGTPQATVEITFEEEVVIVLRDR